MKYVCLMYQDEKAMDKLNPLWQEYGAEFQKSSQLRESIGLAPTHAATTVRVRDGKTLTTDGPFMETKEQLAGVFVIEAADLNEAIQFAAKIPSARLGVIEVRPTWGQ